MHFTEGKMGSFTPDSASQTILRSGQLCVRIVPTLPGPPLVLFRAWTTPSIMKEWFHTGPEWTTPAAEIDPRVGGHYRVAMQNAAGKTYSYKRGIVFCWRHPSERWAQPEPRICARVMDEEVDEPIL